MTVKEKNRLTQKYMKLMKKLNIKLKKDLPFKDHLIKFKDDIPYAKKIKGKLNDVKHILNTIKNIKANITYYQSLYQVYKNYEQLKWNRVENNNIRDTWVWSFRPEEYYYDFWFNRKVTMEDLENKKHEMLKKITKQL